MSAPDVFTALELEPIADSPQMPAGGHRESAGAKRVLKSHSAAPAAENQVAPTEVPSEAVTAQIGAPAGLADLLEPDARPTPLAGGDDSGAITAERPIPDAELDDMPTPVVGMSLGVASVSGEVATAASQAAAELNDELRGGAVAPLVGLPDPSTPVAAAPSALDVLDDDDAITLARKLPAETLAAERSPAAPTSAQPAAAPGPAIVEEVVPQSRSKLPWLWVTLTLMLGGALAWVVVTQTDLADGDIISSREQQAVEEAEAAQRAVDEAAERAKKEYGTATLTSEPKGARVWMIKRGAEVSFENLPRAHEYVFLVDAPGHEPQVRTIKGTEIDAPITVDLDPVENEASLFELPDANPPRLSDAPDAEDVATLTLKSPDDEVRFGLLVGYTPGVRLEDLEVTQVWELLVTKAGHAPHTEIIKGRHWEEAGDALLYNEKVELHPWTEEELSAAEPAGAETSDGETEPPAPKPRKRKKRKKKKKKNKKK